MISKPDYSKIAEYYDASFESGAEVLSHSNESIEKILKKHKVKTVLDLACGTGLQVLYLAKRGFTVVGSDISPGMLKVAKRKARQEKCKIRFLQGDMCNIQVGHFDAVITIFNSVGHLTKTEFAKSMRNIGRNLHAGGLYVFDIFNTNMNKKLEEALSVDAITAEGNKKIHKIQLCKINRKSGVMTMFEEKHVQRGLGKPKSTKWKWTMQTYMAKWLKEMLRKNGFAVLDQYGPHGSKFSDKNSSSILIVAKKL